MSTFVFSGCCSFSWHARGISRGLAHSVLARLHLYQSLILIHPQVETVPWEGHLPPHFSPVGGFACYTAGWQEKQALGFIRFHWSIFISPLHAPSSPNHLWAENLVRLWCQTGGRWAEACYRNQEEGRKSGHLCGRYLVNACGCSGIVNKEQNGHSTCPHEVNSPEEYPWVI